MNWIPLKDQTLRHAERDLQAIFNYWQTDKCGWIISGQSYWMKCHLSKGNDHKYNAINYSGYMFEPDAIWDGDINYIFELKRNAKYEAIGLPEVLHHAHILNNGVYATKNLTPVLICSSTDGNWERASLSYLFKHGLSRDSIHYLQATYLTANNDIRILWLDEPFSHFHQCALSELPAIYEFAKLGQSARYFKCDHADTWAIAYGLISDFAIPPQFNFIYISATDRKDEYTVFNRIENTEKYWLVNTEAIQDQCIPHLIL